MKRAIKYILVFIIMILLFCLSLTITSMIPREKIAKEVKETSEILNIETDERIINIPLKGIISFDNYSDALMVNTAYSIDNETPFYAPLVARKNYIKGKTQIIYPDTTGDLKSSSKYEYFTQVGDLRDTVNNDTTESFEYARYWHGYLIFLRPLLIILNITQIRILLIIILGILFMIFLILIYKKIDISTMIIFLLGMLICDYLYMGISLQGAPIFIIFTVTSIILLSKKIKDNQLIFLITGALTSFFDLLTVPLLTLCVPLLIYVLMEQKEERNNDKKIYINMLLFIIMWGIGYLGIWISKWILIDLIYHKGLIKASINQIVYRTNMVEVKQYNIIEYLKGAIPIIIKPLIISLFIVQIMNTIKITTNRINTKVNIKKIVPYIMIMCIIIVWSMIVANHSCCHIDKFTFRNMLIPSICIMLAMYNIMDVSKHITKDRKQE